MKDLYFLILPAQGDIQLVLLVFFFFRVSYETKIHRFTRLKFYLTPANLIITGNFLNYTKKNIFITLKIIKTSRSPPEFFLVEDSQHPHIMQITLNS